MDDSDEPFTQGIEISERRSDGWYTKVLGSSDRPVAYGERLELARPALSFLLGVPTADGFI